MRIGYSRVSTQDQNLDLQIDALKAAGCEKLFNDEGISGATKARSGLDAAMATIGGKGDTLVVWKLDRLVRSLGFLIELIDQLGKKGAGFQAIQDGIDTNTSGGKLVFHIMGALAEFERDLISKRTVAGMGAARKRGKHVGRPSALTPAQIKHAKRLIEADEESIAGMANLLGVHRNTRTLNLNWPEKYFNEARISAAPSCWIKTLVAECGLVPKSTIRWH